MKLSQNRINIPEAFVPEMADGGIDKFAHVVARHGTEGEQSQQGKTGGVSYGVPGSF